MGCTLVTRPSLPMRALSTTEPSTPLCRAAGGYVGCTRVIRYPESTPGETRAVGATGGAFRLADSVVTFAGFTSGRGGGALTAADGLDGEAAGGADDPTVEA